MVPYATSVANSYPETDEDVDSWRVINIHRVLVRLSYKPA
jgi:hypothetical protein